jgi:peptidoglycan/LPS O-acetylase OafA/YrhL
MFHFYPPISELLNLPSVSTFPQIQLGFLGVDLFFILSGFIMMHVHGKDFETYNFTEHLRFLKLRLSRIYPLHLVCLSGFALLVWFVPGFKEQQGSANLSPTDLLRSVFLIQNWGFGRFSDWNPAAWSLSAEWLGYLTFPLVVLAMHRLVPRGLEMPLAYLLLAGLVAAALFRHAPNLDGVGKVGILRMSVGFLVGCLIHRTLQEKKLESAPGPWGFLISVAIIFICTSRLDWQWGVPFGFALLVTSLARPSKVAIAAFTHPISMWLGSISFSLYLSHQLLLQLFSWIWGGSASTFELHARLVLVGTLIGSTFAISTILWKLVEIPSRGYLRRFALPQSALHTAPAVSAAK